MPRRLSRITFVALLLAALVPAAPAHAGVMCLGRPATIVGTDGDNSNLRGTPGNDVIVGKGGFDNIFGLGGNDLICGGSGTDSLFGGPGDDKLNPQGGQSNGGSGDDLFVHGSARFDGAPRGIHVDVERGTATGWGTDRLNGVTSVIGSSHDDVIKGSAAFDDLAGGPGSDLLVGRAGDDYLAGWGALGRDGQDVLKGGVGDDRLFWSPKADTFDGGSGNDWAQMDGPKPQVVNLLAGTATGTGSDTITGIENVVGSIYDDYLTGDDNDNDLQGFEGNDTLYGYGGNDTLEGYLDEDYADGGDGTDVCDAETVLNCE
ncbi:MAG TPA: calcium-binding protein [Actinomycetota bacterium]|nr:calcium-binding protein [Actinomycetota bacterium]